MKHLFVCLIAVVAAASVLFGAGAAAGGEQPAANVRIDVWHTAGCIPCAQMEPDVESLAREGEPIHWVDQGRYAEIAKKRGINQFPTTVIYVNGIEYERFVGRLTRATLRSAIGAARASVALPIRVAGAVSRTAMEAAIRATCRIFAPTRERGKAATGTGFLYAIGPERRGGERMAWIATAAHVPETDEVSVQFERQPLWLPGRVYWRSRRLDRAVIVVPYGRLPKPSPRPIRISTPGVKLYIGRSVYSFGYPGDGEMQLLTGVFNGFESYTNGTSAIVFRPWPEHGRSGSPLLIEAEAGELQAIGIVTAQASPYRGDPPETGAAEPLTGYQDSSDGWRPTQCQAGQCPGGRCQEYMTRPSNPAIPFATQVQPALPYRQFNEQRAQQYGQRLNQLERSPGSSAIPPPLPMPDQSGELEVKGKLQSLDVRVSELERRADVVRDTANELAEKYEKQLPGISGDVKAAIDASQAAAAAAKTAATVADTAKTEATTAKEDAKKTGEQLKEAVDEENPRGIVGRLKARIAEAKVEATAEGKEGLKAVPGIAKDVAMGILQSYGIPAAIAGIVLAFVVWDIRKKVTEGDPLLVEKVANRVHERLGPARERIVEKVRDRLHPEDSSPPSGG